MKKKLLLIVVIFVLTIIVSALIFGPAIAKGYINKNGKELIGRTYILKRSG